MEIEDQARAEGWVPKEEWKGDPEVWTDAKTFVQRGKELAPILAAKNRKLEKQLEEYGSEIAKLRETSEEFRKLADKSIEKSRQERDAAIAQLQKQRAQAISEGDGDKVIDTEQKIEKLKAEETKESSPEAVQEKWNQQAVQWARENAWYTRNGPEYDEDKRIYADGLADLIIAQQPHLKNDPQGYFKELSRRVEEKFTQTNENRSRSTVESEGGKKSRKTDAKTFENLPDDAKEGFERMKFLMPNLTEEQYLKNYSWE